MNRFSRLLALAAVALAACTPQVTPTTGGGAPGATSAPTEQRDDAQVLKVGVAGISANLSPQATTFPFTGWPIYDNLTTYAANYEVRPSVAEKWELSADRMTWIFTIRNDMKFADGTALTADDVVFTLDTAKKEAWTAYANMANVTGWRATSPTTIELALKQPDVSIPTATVGLWIISKAYSEKNGGSEIYREKPLGTGPYEVVNYKLGDMIQYRVRNATHPFRTPANKEIIYQLIPDSQQRINGMRTGDLDITTQGNFTGDQANQLKAAGMDVRGDPTTELVFTFPYGTFQGKPGPLANVKVRQAINYAVNREQLTKSLYGTYGIPIGQMAIPGSPYFDESRPAHPYDVAKAKSLLAEAGYASGFKLVLDWVVSIGPQELVLGIQSDLKAVGIDVEIKTLDGGAFVDAAFGRNNSVKGDIFPLTTGDSNGFGQSSFFGCNKPNATNQAATFFCNQQWETLIAQAFAEPDAAKRKTILQQANKVQTDDVPALWMHIRPTFVAASPKVRDMKLAMPAVYNFDSAYKVK